MKRQIPDSAVDEPGSFPLARLLTVEETAEILQLPIRTLYQQRHRGVAPGALAVKIGRYLRWDPARLGSWIEAQHRGADR